MKTLYDELKARLKEDLSEYRFEHSVNVGQLAARLGKEHGWEPERARLAGLLHDCVKEWSPKKLKKYVKKRRLTIPGLRWILEASPNMLHAYVAADYVRRKGWIKSKRDLQAIASHTLGNPKMTLEDKILFIADFSANGRKYHSAKRIRKLAMHDLDEAFRESLQLKITWQLKKAKPIHVLPVETWNQVICKMKIK